MLYTDWKAGFVGFSFFGLMMLFKLDILNSVGAGLKLNLNLYKAYFRFKFQNPALG